MEEGQFEPIHELSGESGHPASTLIRAGYCLGQKSACLTDRSRLATVWQSSENAALSAELMDVRELCGNFG